jgi:hypothetical protein
METDLRSRSIAAETPVWTARKSIWNENLAARRLGARRGPALQNRPISTGNFAVGRSLQNPRS